MNGGDDLCVVCGERSAELICRECQALIGSKPLRTERTKASESVRTRTAVHAA
jgi:hypothetical protein